MVLRYLLDFLFKTNSIIVSSWISGSKAEAIGVIVLPPGTARCR